MSGISRLQVFLSLNVQTFPQWYFLEGCKNIARMFVLRSPSACSSLYLSKLNLFLPQNYFIFLEGCKKEGENIARMFVFRSPSAPPSIHLASRESEICLKTRSGKKMKTRSPWPIFLNSFYFIQAWIFLFIWCHRLLFSWEIWLCALLLCCENLIANPRFCQPEEIFTFATLTLSLSNTLDIYRLLTEKVWSLIENIFDQWRNWFRKLISRLIFWLNQES